MPNSPESPGDIPNHSKESRAQNRDADAAHAKLAEHLTALAQVPELRAVLDVLSDGLIIIDPEGRVLFGSLCADVAPPNASTSRSLFAALPFDQAQTLRGVLRAVRESRLPAIVDVKVVLPTGDSRWLTCRISPLVVADLLTGFSIMAVDATRHKRIESALEETRREQTTLLSNLPGMAYRCDNDRHWTMRYVSSGCLALTGHTPEEIVDNQSVRYGDLIVAADRDHVWSAVQSALREGEPFRINYRIRTALGEEKWVWEQGLGVSDATGSVMAIEGFIADISEQRFAQEALHVAHRDLEMSVEERTRELTAANQNLQFVLDERKRLGWLLKAIVDNVPIMLFVKNAETLVVELWNDAAAFLTGIPASEIVGKTGYEVFPKEQMEAFHERDRAVIRFRKLISAEEIITTTRGERLLHTRKIPMFDDNGEPRYLLGISEDITELKRAQVEAEQRTTLATLAAEVAAVITSGIAEEPLLNKCADIIVRRMNLTLARIWTVDPIRQNLQLQASAREESSEVISKPNDALDYKVIRTVATTQRPMYADSPAPDKLHDFGWDLPGSFSSFAAFPFKVDERILGVLAVYGRQSLTEATTKALAALADNIASGVQARRSEDALRHSLERFDLMVEGAKVGLWDAMVVADDPYNPKNPIYYSRRFREMLGFDSHEFPDVIESWSRLLHPEDRDRVFARLDDHLFRRIPFDDEYRVFNRDGEVRWFAARGQAQWDEKGQPIRMSGSFSDITDRKQFEQQLLEAREAAEAATRAKSRFLANISHEIRTPIAAMLNATELLAHVDATDREKRIDLILRNTRHLMSLIDDLLNFSRLEAGKLEITCMPCSLVEVLADIRAVTTPLANKPNVEFRVEAVSDIPETIVTDPIRLRQAVINLVNNALKFTDAGQVVLRVGVDPDAPEPRLTIEVSDSGIGIPAPELARVFEAFERVTQTGARMESGVGLGLTISRWIAVQLGGDLTVRSTPGIGSTFTLRVTTGPIDGARWLAPAQWIPATAVSVRRAPQVGPGQLSGKVLLAEDYADTREVLIYALTTAGAQVTAVENGLDAVEAASKEAFDLILMDIRMPKMDGLTATIELRKRGCLVPIIALTASTASSERERVINAGFDDFWTKPISIDRLIHGASAYLSGSVQSPMPAEPEIRTTPTMRTKLERLAAEFVASLPERMKFIRDRVMDQDPREAVNRIHQLIGTAGVHGFDDVCAEAARLQRRFRETGTLNLEDLAALERAVAALKPPLVPTDVADSK